ncbi:MAG: sigma-70 family RNA polymerase sigma factor [Fuerstiella sp.]
MNVESVSDEQQDRFTHCLIRSVQHYLAARVNQCEPTFEETACWEEFFIRFDPVVRQVVRKSGLPRGELEDAVQAAWLEIIRALPRLQWRRASERQSLYGWIQVVIRRRMGKFRRQSERTNREVQSRVYPDQTALHTEPLDHLCRHEEQESVRDLLLQLQKRVSPKSYQIVCMRWLDGASMDVIAEQTNLTPEQVRVRHHRAKHQLVELIRFADDK